MAIRQAEPTHTPEHAKIAHGSGVERAVSWLSLACAVHCLVVPIALGAMPLLDVASFELDASVELPLNVLVVVSAVLGALWGYRRHRELRFVLATALGLALYLAGHTLEPHWYGTALAVLGALLLGVSAYFGARLSHAHVHPHHAHSSLRPH